MEIEIRQKRRKTKVIGVRLYKEEYDFISEVARKKKASRSFVAETLLRAAMSELNPNSVPTDD
jgi:hypothetical protein